MRFIYFLLLFLFITACTTPKKPKVEELFEVDLEFSKTSGEIGFNKAFVEFAHDSAVLLRENSMPIVGKASIKKLFENASANGVEFSWQPLNGDISASGELGYTYGIYQLKKDTTPESGTYVSIWKKDSSGKWKYVLDTGNKGLGN